MANFSSTYPATKPVFMADFANGGKIDPRATFSRPDSPINFSNAPASAVHYWSNEKHLSSENLISYSNPTQNWVTTKTTRSTSGSFLDGSDSYLIAETTDTGAHYTAPDTTSNAANFVSGTEYTAVVYAKAGTVDILQLAFTTTYFGANAYANFDLSNASTTPVTGSAATATITSLGSGWVKLTLTAPATASGASFPIVVGLTNNDINAARLPTYTGATASNVLIWEANVSTTGQKVLNQTSGQIHREYAPTLKSPATAGAARFEHDPETNVSLGCLIEGQSTNELLYSANFDESYWTKNNSTVQLNAGVSPDGNLAADLVTADATGAATTHNIAKIYSFTSGTTYTLSVYAKAAGLTQLTLQAGNTATWSASTMFTLTGSGSTAVSSGSAAIQPCGNGWFRCSVTGTAGATASTNLLLKLVSGGSDSFDGDDLSGTLLWGAQFEQASHPSSYITTLVTARTRAADSMSMTDANLFDNGGGTLFAEYDASNPSAVAGIAAITDGTGSSNAVSLRLQASTVKLFVNNAGATQAATSTTAPSAGVFQKIAGRYAVNDFGVSVNGGTVVTDANGSVPVISKLEIGTMDNGSYHLNGHVKRVAIYPALSDTNLQAITS